MARDFLSGLSGLIEKPEIQSALKMLGGHQPSAGVSENLTVPFGLTFDQGQRLRETAVGLDDSRNRANAEAQRIALETREADTRAKATEHAIKNANLTDLDKTLTEYDTASALQEQQGEISASLENQRSKNDLVVNRQDREDEIAIRRMDYDMANDPEGIDYVKAMSEIAVNNAQIVSYEAAAAASENEILKSQLKAAGVPDAETKATLYQNWLAGEERIKQRMTVQNAAGFDEAPDAQTLNRSLTGYWIQGYLQEAVDASALGPWLPADEFAEVLRLEQVRARGNQQEIAAERAKFKQDWEDDFSLNQSTPDNSPMNQPIQLEVNETLMEGQGVEKVKRNRPAGKEPPPTPDRLGAAERVVNSLR